MIDQHPIEQVQACVSLDDITRLKHAITEIRISNELKRYAVDIVHATRTAAGVDLGASPRATMSLYRTCQALAAIRGRDYVLPDDVKTMAPYVLTHRLIIGAKTRLRGRQPADIIKDVVNTVAVPVES
jgi:MoxR-like ATPase